MKKAVKCLFFALIICVALFASPVSASTTRSQAEAVNYLNSLAGQKIGSGWCTDLAKHYYNYLGQGGYAHGNGRDYANNVPPGWTKLPGSAQPAMGDIAVYTYGGWVNGVECGHVFCITGVDATGHNMGLHQNYNNKRYCSLEYTRNSAISYLIRPDFNPEPTPTPPAPSPPADTTAPTLGEPCIANISSDGYDAFIIARDDSGIQKVEFPTWTLRQENGTDQDDLPANWPWGVQIGSSDSYFYDIKRSDHKNEYGNYLTHIYASDNAGNRSVAHCPVVDVPEPAKDDGIPDIYYCAHIEKMMWRGYTRNGGLAGSERQFTRAEAFKIKVEDNPYGGGVEYRAYVAGNGWLDWVSNDAQAGTTGQSRQLEGIEIKLTGELANYYDVTYRAHCADVGWQSWVSNGDLAGSTDKGRRLEGLEIKLVKKDNPTPTKFEVSTSANPTEGGTVTGAGSYEKNKTATLKATANDGYSFDGWYNGDTKVSSDPTYTLVVESDLKLEARFTKNQVSADSYTVSVSASPGDGGSVSGGGSYGKGESVTVKAIPNDGYSFDGWYNGDTKVSGEASYQFYVSANTTLTARFNVTSVGDDTTPPVSESSVEIYRLYNGTTGEHLYTISQAEVKALTAAGWNYEGVGWVAPNTGQAVYRLYNSAINDHLYTMDENEAKTLTTRGWTMDFGGEPIFYSGGSTPVYRLYNETTKRHHLTTDAFEYEVLAGNGWKQEGEALRAMAK